MLTREEIRAALLAELQGRDDVLGFWEAGSAARGRVDEWSDLDLAALVRKGANEAVWEAVHGVFRRLGGITLRWHEPQPVFAGLDKRTYRLTRAPRWLQVDVGFFREDAPDIYNQRPRHGEPVILLDREGRLGPPAWDEAEHSRRMRVALHHEIMKFKLYGDFFRKESARGRSIDALRMYLAYVVRPPVNVLGMLHRPAQWDFDLRYLHDVLPLETLTLVERVAYPGGPDGLEAGFRIAHHLFWDTVVRLSERGLTPIDPGGDDVGGEPEPTGADQ